MSEAKRAAIPTGGWLRGKAYRDKWDIGKTTYWKLKKEDRLEIHNAGGFEYVKDQPPSPTPLES